MKRFKMSRGRSKRLFRRTAAKVHRKNLSMPIMRGGVRL